MNLIHLFFLDKLCAVINAKSHFIVNRAKNEQMLMIKHANTLRMTILYPNILYSRDCYYTLDIFWCVNRIGQS